LSISLIGNYDSSETIKKGDAVYNTLVQQIKDWVEEYNIKKENIYPHTRIPEEDDPDEADEEGTVNTACPGNNVLILWNDLINDVYSN
jgi:hypothetical protein